MTPFLGAGSSRAKLRALAVAQPLTAHLELTYRCPWRCVFCYNPRHFDRAPLTLPEWLTVLDELRRLGTLTVTLTGGEPLAHPEFFRIAEAAREKAFAVIVFTNGALVDVETADRLADLDLLAVEQSLHGAGARSHDQATATPGSFEAATGAITRLLARKVRVRLKMPVTGMNIGELEAMVAFAQRLGVPCQIDPIITPRDDGDLFATSYSVGPADLEKTYRLVAEEGQLPMPERTTGGVNCGLGRLTLAVDPEGNVYPCLQWRTTALGNVRSQRLSEMWRSSPAREEAAHVARAANDMLLDCGGPLARFPYCPALAAQHTGNALTPDQGHRMRAEAVDRVRLARASAGGTQ